MERIPGTDRLLRGRCRRRRWWCVQWRGWVQRLAFLVGLSCWPALVLTAQEEEPAGRVHRDGFESVSPSWRISAETTETAQLRRHERTPTQVHSGRWAEYIQLDAIRRDERIFIEHALPPALVFEELTASVWVHSNRPGVKLGVRIVFPNQIDPRTNRPLTADLFGSEYTTPRRWQQLTCRTTETEVRKLVGRVRAQLARSVPAPDLNAHGLYVDRVVLSLAVAPGGYEFALDDLELGPLVEPTANGAPIVQVHWDEPFKPPLTLGDGRLLRDGQPFFPVVAPYHGEDPQLLRRLGFNVVWIPKFDDQALLTALGEAGLGAMAAPPVPELRSPETSSIESSSDAGLPPFSAETANILFWTLGCEIPATELRSVHAAAEAVRDADPYRRPIFADVTGNAREFHRSIDLLGLSRHSIHTSLSPTEYAAFLERAQQQALRSKPTFAWIFLEPNAANLANRPREAAPPVVEFEQVLMQMYAALGAGQKGLGFWKHTRLDDASPAGVERRNAVLIANLQLHLLRRWIAAGKVVDLAPVRLGEGTPPGPRGWNQTLLTRYNRLAADVRPPDALAGKVRAPVLRSDAGWLILPQWLEADAQYQPGAMTAQDVRLLLRGEEAPHAWIVTPTGVHPHEVTCNTQAAGGTEIRLARLEQCAAIVLTRDLALIEELRRETQQTRELAGPAYVELVQARLDRVQLIHAELQRLAPKPVQEGDFILAEAQRELRLAEKELHGGNFDAARLSAERVLRLTRLVMRAHWENAARSVAAPVSTPYTISFQTLPDFWRLMQSVGRGRPTADNLLPGGSFETWDNLLYPGGWSREVHDSAEQLRTAMELSSGGVSGRCLRLAAWAVDSRNPPLGLEAPPVRLASPPIPVYSGQIVHIRGQVRIEVPVTGDPDGLMVYDNLSGTVGALRWGSDAPRGRWLPFELLRPVQRSGDLQVTIELCGLGDVRVDELSVKTITPAE
jgi:hypothetical protein